VKTLRTGTWRLLPLLAVLALGCNPPGKPKPADRPVPADQVKDFDTLFATRCAGCHGADGKLGPAPPLNDPLFLAIVPDEELLHVITEGRGVTPTQKTPMPAFGLVESASLTEAQVHAWADLKKKNHIDPRQHGVLTEAQINVLAEGIKQRWQAAAPAEGDVPPYLAPTGSGDKEEGKRVFARACAGCHGSQGQGGNYGERQVGAINNPAFLGLISDQALRRYAITGRPDLGMPPFDGKAGRPPDFRPLTSAEIHDLVAWLAYWRLGGPADDK
jgi:cytochrome c oxidase cbb3-type subunit 3/ubiquinol-cytochrome c reductase cytochrome c subunit